LAVDFNTASACLAKRARACAWHRVSSIVHYYGAERRHERSTAFGEYVK
jgi:hypothetical protein